MILIMHSPIEGYLHNVRHQRIVLEKGRFLFHAGDPIKALHIVQTGSVQLVRHQRDGSRLVLQKAGPGSIVAEASLYADTYHCDAMAASAAQLLTFPKTDIQQRLRCDPDFAETWARHLAHELQRVRHQAEILAMKTVAQRLDAWIAWRGGDAAGGGAWKLIAGEISVSPEALYRELAKRRRLPAVPSV